MCVTLRLALEGRAYFIASMRQSRLIRLVDRPRFDDGSSNGYAGTT
jgi:hypothetical protein